MEDSLYVKINLWLRVVSKLTFELTQLESS